MNKFFVDTSGWVAMLVNSDYHHQNAVKINLDLLSTGFDIVTHEGILLEVGNALSGVKTRGAVMGLLESISASARIELIPLTPALTGIFVRLGLLSYFNLRTRENFS